jgi:signal transduction histidine kinase
MRLAPSWLRTISGRIVLGFVVLQTTFGVVAGYTIWQMNGLGERLRFIRSAYLEIAPDVAFLQYYSAQAAESLDNDPTVARRPFMLKNREDRRAALVRLQQRLADLEDVPRESTGRVAETRHAVEAMARQHEVNEKDFEKGFGGRDVTAAKEALSRLATADRKMAKDAQVLHNSLQSSARDLLRRTETAERIARWYSLALGALASFVALLVTIWAVLTLRPLRRLAEGARRVARGDYRGRVDATGGTEVAELAEEFNAMAGAIEEREQELVRSARLAAVGKMAAVITHEVRNPLSSIGLNAELLDEELGKVAAGTSPDEARTLLVAMQKEVDRLTDITEEYLRFARLPRPRLEKEQLADIASGLVEFQKGELETRGIHVQAELARDLPPVMADEAQIRQALLNLVRNAAEAMSPGGGTLRLSTARGKNGSVEVRVADTGPGIPPEHLDRIFEPFFSTKDGGTGLGLALTQQIVVEHGGKLHVESSASGTTFVVELPVAADAA